MCGPFSVPLVPLVIDGAGLGISFGVDEVSILFPANMLGAAESFGVKPPAAKLED